MRILGKSSPIYFIDGQVYEVVGTQCGFWRIIDESGDDYLYGPGECFEVIEGDPNELREIPLGE